MEVLVFSMDLAPAYDSAITVGHSHNHMDYNHLCRDCRHRPAERDGLCTECLTPDDLVYYE